MQQIIKIYFKIKKDYTLRYYGGNVANHLDLHTVTLRVKIPACGKSEYKLIPCDTPVRYLKKLKSGANYAENEFIRLDISNDGTLDITNKANGKKYSNLCYFVDDGEIGDGWYHANPVCDRVVYSNGSPCAIEKIENGPSRCVFKITKKLEVPEELADFRNGKSRSEKTVELKLVSYVGLSEESPFIDVNLSYDNIAKDHRLRMFVPTGIDSDKYFSGQAFCCVETKVGIDYLVERASREKVSADDAYHSAEKYMYLTESFSNAKPASQEVYDTADKMYVDVKKKINTFVAKADDIINEGSQSGKHEKIESGKPYGNFELVGMAVSGGKLFVMLLLIAFLIASFIEGTSKLISKRELEDKE